MNWKLLKLALGGEVRSNLWWDLAELEHEQLMAWAKTLMETESLSQERIDRWKEYMIPFSELSSKAQEHNLHWADRLLVLIEKELGIGHAGGKLYSFD